MHVQAGTPVTVKRTDSAYWTFSGEVVAFHPESATARVRLFWVPGEPTLAFGLDELQVDCSQCCDIRPGMIAPRHNANPRCESGGHPHCTCEVCF